MEILRMEQGSDEWFAARCGIPTASNFSKILAKGRGGAPSKTRLAYLRDLAGERLTGQAAETFTNHHMDRGKSMEAEARSYYEFTEGVSVEQVGFIKNHDAGYSPDGLVGDQGLWECKTMLPRILIEHLEAGRVPPEHIPQCQGGMWIAEREWLDFRGYWPSMPNLSFRIARDDAWIDGTLAPAVRSFLDELEDLVARLSRNVSQAITPAVAPVDLSTAPPAF